MATTKRIPDDLQALLDQIRGRYRLLSVAINAAEVFGKLGTEHELLLLHHLQAAYKDIGTLLALVEKAKEVEKALENLWVADDNDGLWLRIELPGGRKAAFNMGKSDARRITTSTLLGWHRARSKALATYRAAVAEAVKGVAK